MQSFKTNVLYGLGFSILLLTITSVASYVSITNLIESSLMVRSSNKTIRNIHEIAALLKDAETGQRGFIITNDQRFLAPYNTAKEKLDDSILSLSTEIIDTPIQKKNFENLQNLVFSRLSILDENLSYSKQGIKLTTEQMLDGKKFMDDIRSTLYLMQKEEERVLATRIDNVNKFASYTPSLIIISALLSIVITLFFYRKVDNNYKEITNLSSDLELKNRESENRLVAIEKVSHEISNGNYNIIWDQNTHNTLGSVAESLNKMAKSLRESIQSLEHKERLSSKIAQLNNNIVGEKSIEELSNTILDQIILHTKSNIGAIYLYDEDNKLHLTGSYALGPSAKNKFDIGEGIVGEVFRSKKQMVLRNNTANDFTITYGTGESIPQTVVALPITRHFIPVGVLELGTTQDYSNLHIEYLNSITENIGLAFYGSQNKIKLQELLEETQAQSEELQTQHTELENINAELEAQSQKLLASEEELRVQQEELLRSNLELEERSSLLEEKNALIEKHNQEIQQKSSDLEQSTKYKSEFLANMSHELRTPLNSILLLSKLMAESEDLDEQYVEYAEVMQTSGQGLLTLIDEILDLSKIEAGKMTLEVNDVRIDDIANDMKSLFSPLATEKNLDLKISSEEANIQIIKTDKLRVEQILKNLLSNAIKFTSKGSVTLDISQDNTLDQIYFRVIDTGIGIPSDKINMVFEAFQQADGSTQRKYGGTGLGLSISRELARLLGGEIQLKSKINEGSEFTLVLPIDFNEKDSKIVQDAISNQVDKKEINHVEPVEKIQRFISNHIPQAIEDDRENLHDGDKVILIIEDDTAFAKILLDFTRKRNYKGLVSVRGDLGIEMAQHYKPLAILLDIQLPIMDGWQVMEALKSNPITKPIPVHIMSSMKFRQESLLRGAVDFINKPFALDEMQVVFSKLENALNRDPKKVLIVEENEQHAKALRYFLTENNIQTDIATNVNDSIDALHKKEVDCVILDMGVPDKNAYETLDIIKRSKGLEQLPIIVFTGKNLSKGEESRIKKYADSIVVKTVYSYQRILDETGLFLHLVEEKSKKGLDQQFSIGQVGELRNILKNRTVLIADDDVRNIFSLTKVLEMNGMKVIPAMDGKEAIKILKKETTIDIVLMDMMMPEMDGYESIREIRFLPKFKNLPIIAVTSKAMMGDREKCFAVGASDYISKPVDVDQLVSLLRVWLYDKI